ncbi:MAG TPA: aldehyde dehydrogenase family protein, partial [Candidatus Margulisiibacteriota bacterium]|nr:aldehyde dehydrogenase family protein [Candidatus Margulisiibacteriota bacterium]
MEARYELWIGGAPRPPRGGRYFPSTNPATGEQLTAIALGDRDDVAAAVAAAQAAFPAWRDRKPIERGRILLDVAGAIRAQAAALAELEQLETGKPAYHA